MIFFFMLKWLWELMSEPTAHRDRIKMSFGASLGIHTEVSSEVTQCINGGDISWSAGKMRAYGINPPKDTKAGDDQVYQTLLDLFNIVYHGLFVLDRAIFSGCPGRRKTPPSKVSMNIWEDCSNAFIHLELACSIMHVLIHHILVYPAWKSLYWCFLVVSAQQVGFHSC